MFGGEGLKRTSENEQKYPALQKCDRNVTGNNPQCISVMHDDLNDLFDEDVEKMPMEVHKQTRWRMKKVTCFLWEETSVMPQVLEAIRSI